MGDFCHISLEKIFFWIVLLQGLILQPTSSGLSMENRLNTVVSIDLFCTRFVRLVQWSVLQHIKAFCLLRRKCECEIGRNFVLEYNKMVVWAVWALEMMGMGGHNGQLCIKSRKTKNLNICSTVHFYVASLSIQIYLLTIIYIPSIQITNIQVHRAKSTRI